MSVKLIWGSFNEKFNMGVYFLYNYNAYADNLFINSIDSSTQCAARIKDKTYPCMLGINGVIKEKQEGDGATPSGEYPIRRIFYRKDREGDKLKDIKLPVQKLEPDDAWCDDVDSPEYNKHVNLQFSYSNENLWRDDHLYDIIGVVGYNDNPIIKGKGNAIFLHIMSPEKKPTAGCISFSESDLIEILHNIDDKSKIIIH